MFTNILTLNYKYGCSCDAGDVIRFISAVFISLHHKLKARNLKKTRACTRQEAKTEDVIELHYGKCRVSVSGDFDLKIDTISQDISLSHFAATI